MAAKFKFRPVEAKKTESLEAAELLKKDPIYLANLVLKLTEEKQTMNLMLKEINQKLEKLESGSTQQNVSSPVSQNAVKKRMILLPEVDEKILEFIKKNGNKACADEVQKRLNYKGKNAASSRLNRLVSKGLLEKQQVGRKVFFILLE
jgi:uncharacterized membrane protein